MIVLIMLIILCVVLGTLAFVDSNDFEEFFIVGGASLLILLTVFFLGSLIYSCFSGAPSTKIYQENIITIDNQEKVRTIDIDGDMYYIFSIKKDNQYVQEKIPSSQVDIVRTDAPSPFVILKRDTSSNFQPTYIDIDKQNDVYKLYLPLNYKVTLY